MLFFFLGICVFPDLRAQQHDLDSLWSTIQIQQEQLPDTSFHFILDQVRDHCGKDYNCQYQTYRFLSYKIGYNFDLAGVIFVAEEMVRIARLENDTEAEGHAYIKLSSHHGAMGNKGLGVINLEKALNCFEQIGNWKMTAGIKMSKLENSLNHRKLEEVMPEMLNLLAEATERNEIEIKNNYHERLMLHTLSAGLYDDALKHLKIIEKSFDIDSLTQNDYGRAIHINRVYAELAIAEKDMDKAVFYYKKALKLCREEPSHWLEILTLQSLTNLEWEQGNVQAAKNYLELAETKAHNLELHDLLTYNYNLKAKIAEEERRFSDAIEFMKKEQFHDEKFKSRSAGFNVESYYLKFEKDQLATEKEKQELALKFKKAQLRNYSISLAVVLLLAIGLAFGLISHRKSMLKLADQNRLIQQQSEELKSLDVAKSRFFANVSHELRTPLTLILGPIKTALKSGALNNWNFTLLTTARQNTQNLLQLIGSILDLSKIEHGKLTLEEKPVNLFLLVRRIISAFESHAQREGIELTFYYRAERDLRLQIDGAKLKDILNNLLTNAIKFTQRNGKIEVITIDKGNAILISVKDTGRGITPKDLPHVFDRFYQSKEENAPTEGGTGIGLAFCKELTTLMGGKIWVESQSGEGSIFYVELPRKEVLGVPEEIEEEREETHESIQHVLAEKVRAHNEHENPASESIRPTILVVEDNYSLRDYMTTILEPFYNVLTGSNGQDALNLLDENSNSKTQTIPSLIISDVMMPVMDGFQLMEKLKADVRYNRLPIIMLTARADIRDKLKALRIGVDDYLLKPFDEEEVLVRISNLLETYAVRKEVSDENATQKKETSEISEQNRQWLESFEMYIQQKLSDEMINIPDLARQFAMSESTLLRQLKYLTGMTPKKYVQEMRLDKARRLLEQNVYNSVSRVAIEVGYRDSRSFSRSFKKRFGKLPSEYLGSGVV